MIQVFSRCNPLAKQFSFFGCGKRRGVRASALLTPPLVGGRQYLKSSDNTWHLLDLALDNGLNSTRVEQAPTASPGSQYRGYVVLVASGTKHKLSLVNDGGIHTLYLDQDLYTPTVFIGITAFTSLSLISTDANTYLLKGLFDGYYTLWVGQP